MCSLHQSLHFHWNIEDGGEVCKDDCALPYKAIHKKTVIISAKCFSDVALQNIHIRWSIEGQCGLHIKSMNDYMACIFSQ